LRSGGRLLVVEAIRTTTTVKADGFGAKRYLVPEQVPQNGDNHEAESSIVYDADFWDDVHSNSDVTDVVGHSDMSQHKTTIKKLLHCTITNN
jgi:hypothetical protein